ncbi:low specificity L-threonine aldolase [Halolamina sp. CBA1230]|uniref:threonine aldolase family protein n=1 Tax=Halolamina sp. CBA1230 TaxID=1853690 RepID=UPI0009A15ED1|nr:GntG family PLP-dependent aldolase [Halolamina sp. CBA1230]QKY21149.1 low specificity L-threonine aldolase [Halolamina sp. CBA1230]
MVVDLRSDTVTKPSDAMREAAKNAEVGDDVYQDDPSVNELEARAAEILGKEAGLFVPSGTMGNQVAIRTHTDRGQELLADEHAHVLKWELGGIAQLSSLQTRLLDFGESAVPTPQQVEEGVVEESLHEAGTGLFCLENTHNYRGGVAVSKAQIDAAASVAHDHDVPVHLDGARLFNAAAALDVDAAELADSADSVMFCLSKGLGAPVGSVLVGEQAFIDRARRTRKLFGGGMRQAGMIAAPGLLALENRSHLDADHRRADRIAEGLGSIDGIETTAPDTNIVVADVEGTGLNADEFVGEIEQHGVLAVAFSETTVRFTTNWDVSDADVEGAIDSVRTAMAAV